jgi:anti-sigma B factor antagonist
MDLTVTTESDDQGRRIVSAIGSLDMQSRHQLIDAARAALAAKPAGLLLDLDGVDFIDSTGISALVEAANDSAELEIAFGIRNPSARAKRVLDLTGLSQLWSVESDSSV